MTENWQATYLNDIKKTARYYKELGEGAIHQVSPNRINWYFQNDTNSLSIIVKHLSGNLCSRFTDFLTTDGEKPWRKRDDEFRDDVIDKKQMMEIWEKGWKCLLDSLDNLDPEDVEKTVYIRSEAHTVTQALNRSMTHLSYHVGQIVFLSKMLAETWDSLSIPKGQSESFTAKKMGEHKVS